MPRIVTTLEFHQKPKDHLWDMMRRIYEQLASVFNGNIGLGNVNNMTANGNANPNNTDNIRGAMIYVTAPGVANTAFTVNHNLGILARGFIVVFKDRACDVYDDGTGPTNTSQRTLKCTVASANIVLFCF